jgi:fructuronate reductase
MAASWKPPRWRWRASDPDTAAWIADHVRFPNAMVDSITPATDDALRAQVAQAIGLEDAWPIQRDPSPNG